jgi:hypothetical protein
MNEEVSREKHQNAMDNQVPEELPFLTAFSNHPLTSPLFYSSKPALTA